jgi:hypothetical protein
MATYSTPGVYVEEIPNLAPSVAPVATAIPVFIGYTEKGAHLTPTRIDTMLDYVSLFGNANPSAFEIKADNSVSRTDEDTNKFLMYYGLSLYFQNGGGSCYIVSVGDYTSTPAKEDFTKALDAIEKEDEPTLIVLLDATTLATVDYYELCNQALLQCKKLGDRFLIVDVPNGEKIDDFRSGIGSNNLCYAAAYYPYLQTTLNPQYTEAQVTQSPTSSLATLKSTNTSLYSQIKTNLANQRVTLPPSPAIAGVYASVDRERGVWKSPANVSLNAVIAPVTKISDSTQDSLNIDPTAGKSVNAIRSFTGKGTLVWGGRTLAGNDNEWRYISVRRLFITIEESTRKASSFAVFEPNDATTWLKVKAMIESYLYGLWQQGALAGSKPESAYFVSIGLGKTMTAQDILEGKMIVSIGVAAVRPAEFIVLRFSHKMQEA